VVALSTDIHEVQVFRPFHAVHPESVYRTLVPVNLNFDFLLSFNILGNIQIDKVIAQERIGRAIDIIPQVAGEINRVRMSHRPSFHGWKQFILRVLSKGGAATQQQDDRQKGI